MLDPNLLRNEPDAVAEKLARERYKAYRVAGFNLNTATWK